MPKNMKIPVFFLVQLDYVRAEAATRLSAGGLRTALIAEVFFFFFSLISSAISHSRSGKQKAPRLPCLFALRVQRECCVWTQQPVGLLFHSFTPSAAGPAACVRARVCIQARPLCLRLTTGQGGALSQKRVR